MAKKKSAKSLPKKAVQIEDAMDELQEIVTSLESGQEPLDESLQKFERGMALLRSCHQQLERAAQRIELVTRIDADGNVETRDFDGTSTFDRTDGDQADDDAADSAKLF